MTSRPAPIEAYVWIWLPDKPDPVVAGRIQRDRHRFNFNYGRSYLQRHDAIAIYEPELPLEAGIIEPPDGMRLASALRDASPDAWGRRVILNRLVSNVTKDSDNAELDELTYLLASGSDRIGGLDFQESATKYIARAEKPASLEEMMNAAALVEKGVPLTTELEQAMFHGTSLGGARPKANIEDNTQKYIAKFASSTDTYNIVKAEYIAMKLAKAVGLNVADVVLRHSANKDILLVERFDRDVQSADAKRRLMVSVLTILGLDEMMARYASYEDLSNIIRHRFQQPKATLHELFARLVFNVICGNTDDHARNHAAFWSGSTLTLTPAYDICPQNRAGNEASQAMLITGQNRQSRLAVCLAGAAKFLLTSEEATTIVTRQIRIVQERWQSVCDDAGFSEVDRRLFWRRMFFNPFIFEGAPDSIATLEPA